MVRAYIIKFVGKDGKRCSVTFDRYGMNNYVFSLPEERVLPQATSDAMASVFKAYGTDWVQEYKVVTVD